MQNRNGYVKENMLFYQNMFCEAKIFIFCDNKFLGWKMRFLQNLKINVVKNSIFYWKAAIWVRK